MISAAWRIVPSSARAVWEARAVVRQGVWKIVEDSAKGTESLKVELVRHLFAKGGLERAERAERRIAERRIVPQGALVCVIEEPPLVICTATERETVIVVAWLVAVFPEAAKLPAVCCHEDELRERIA